MNRRRAIWQTTSSLICHISVEPLYPQLIKQMKSLFCRLRFLRMTWIRPKIPSPSVKTLLSLTGNIVWIDRRCLSLRSVNFHMFDSYSLVVTSYRLEESKWHQSWILLHVVPDSPVWNAAPPHQRMHRSRGNSPPIYGVNFYQSSWPHVSFSTLPTYGTSL